MLAEFGEDAVVLRSALSFLTVIAVACGAKPPAPAVPESSQPAREPEPEPEPEPSTTAVQDRSVVITKGPIDPQAPEQWLANVAEYDSRKEGLVSVADHLALGEWAYEQGLEDEAWEQFAAAMKANAGAMPAIDAYARRAMGLLDPKAGAAVGANEALVDAKRIRAIRDAGLAFSFTVAIEDDAPPEFYEELKWRLRRMNWFFWRVTEGQMFLDELVLEDQTSNGRFVIERGKLELTLLSGGGAFCVNAGEPDWSVVSAGRVYTRVLSHEMLHGVFGLPDERHGCACIMQGGLYGIRSDQLAMCDDEGHRSAGSTPVSCWSLAQARYPSLERSDPVAWGAPPEPKFVVNDH